MVKTRSASRKRIQELIRLAQRAGLKRLKVGEIELELGPVSRMNSVDKADKETETKTEAPPTDEELLNWSAPMFDQV